MPLTPAEIHNVEFGKASRAKRGYDEEQVDALLDEVTQEMIKLLEENDVLQRRAGRADPLVDGPAASGGAIEAELSAVAAELDRARRACDRAEQNAGLMRRQLDQARQAASAGPAVVADGEFTDAVLAMAQRTSDDHLQSAYQQSHALLTEARERSERLIREAREMASDVERDADRHESDTKTELQTRRTDLQREVDELTRFAADYRAALESHVLRQRRHLDGTADKV